MLPGRKGCFVVYIRRIMPLYYKMSENGIPIEWVRLMKETIKSTAAGFSTRRMVKQYIEKFYAISIKKALEDDVTSVR
jgi:starch phosphorylase